MAPPFAFVSSFTPPAPFRGSGSQVQTCSVTSPRMALLSHEKTDILLDTGDNEIARYRLDLKIPAEHSKLRRKESIQAMKQHANFPGFRRGTIPPFIMKQIEGFVLRDSVEDMVGEAASELNLGRSKGEDADADYDYNAAIKDFVIGTDFTISCMVTLTTDTDEKKSVDEFEDIISLDEDVSGPEIDLNTLKEQVKDTSSRTPSANE